MKKVFIQNLGMIVTNKCNLDCAHCLRGCKNDKDMSKEVIDATLNQLTAIGNLNICGGEPILALDTIEYLFDSIVKKKIGLHNAAITINGSIYSPTLLQLLDYINNYIKQYCEDGVTILGISYDKYHKEQLIKKKLWTDYLKNINKYIESSHFYELRELRPEIKLYNEGNAEHLDSRLTEDLEPVDIVTTYIDDNYNFDKEGICCIGPFITVNTDGIITEDNSSLIHQATVYNYGNVFANTFEEIALTKGTLLEPNQWLEKSDEIIKKYTHS